MLGAGVFVFLLRRPFGAKAPQRGGARWGADTGDSVTPACDGKEGVHFYGWLIADKSARYYSFLRPPLTVEIWNDGLEILRWLVSGRELGTREKSPTNEVKSSLGMKLHVSSSPSNSQSDTHPQVTVHGFERIQFTSTIFWGLPDFSDDLLEGLPNRNDR